jgi:hypothetical protein
MLMMALGVRHRQVRHACSWPFPVNAHTCCEPCVACVRHPTGVSPRARSHGGHGRADMGSPRSSGSCGSSCRVPAGMCDQMHVHSSPHTLHTHHLSLHRNPATAIAAAQHPQRASSIEPSGTSRRCLCRCLLLGGGAFLGTHAVCWWLPCSARGHHPVVASMCVGWAARCFCGSALLHH